MDGYEVEIRALRTAADAANSAGEQARQVTTRTAVTDAPGAMPGSVSSSAITAWAGWFDRVRIEAWATAAAEHGARLTEAADLYCESDRAAAAAFGSIGAGGATPE